jgi:hypothetical protein
MYLTSVRGKRFRKKKCQKKEAFQKESPQQDHLCSHEQITTFGKTKGNLFLKIPRSGNVTYNYRWRILCYDNLS